MKKPTQEDTKQLLDYLGARLFSIENYYHIYSELGLHYNKAVNQASSKKYLEVINRHKGFFMPVQEALRATLTVELCSFVVKKERKYKSIGRAIDDLKGLPGAPDLNDSYDALLEKNSNTISHLEKFRNQYYAHKSYADLLTLPTSSDKEFRELLDDLEELLNSAMRYFDAGMWFMKDEAVDDTHSLMNNLIRGEAQRVSEVETEYISEVYRHGRNEWHGK